MMLHLDDLRKRVQASSKRWDQNALDWDLFTTLDPCDLNRSSISINDSFLFFQVCVNQLLRMKHLETDREEFCDQCTKIYQKKCENDSDKEYLKKKLEEIDEFRTDIGSTEAVLTWYTKDAFLYDMVNTSFRTNDAETIFYSRFVIREMWQQLKKRQINSAIRVYRGQRMSSTEVELLRNSIDKLVSMKSFLSTSRSRNVAEIFAGFESNDTNENIAFVLFIIDAVSKESNKILRPFGDISDVSHFAMREEEILFMAGSVFRITNITQDNNKQWIISMTMCDQEDIELNRIFCWLKGDQNINGIDDSPDYNFADLLLAMGMPDEAQKCCHKLLDKYRLYSPQNNELAKCYHMLGRAMLLLGSPPSSESSYLEKSLQYFDKALDHIDEITTNCCALRGSINHSKANAHRALFDFENALDTYEIAMVYYSESIGMKHRLTANLYADLGQMYFEKKDLDTALHYHKRARYVANETLTNTHLEMGIFHMRLVAVYAAMGKKFHTLFHLCNALNIDLTSLPNNIPPLLSSCALLSIIYAHKESISTFQENKNIMHGNETIQQSNIKPTWSSKPKVIEYSCPWCSNGVWIYRQLDFLKGSPCFRCLSNILKSQEMDPRMAPILDYFVHHYGR